MNRLPFEELLSSMEFQQLCAELLQAEGCKNISGLGTGNDLGKDILIDVPISSPLGYRFEKFIVQCKWYKTANNVGHAEIGDIISYMSLHNAKGILMITSSEFTGTAVNKMDSINNDNRSPYEIKYWNGFSLSRLLLKHPQLIRKYWYKSSEKEVPYKLLPEYNFKEMKDRYKVPPLYSNSSLESFPNINENLKYIENLTLFTDRFLRETIEFTIIDGVIGAGKTGFGCTLLNLVSGSHCEVAFLNSYDFNQAFFEYVLESKMYFLLLNRFLEEVDYLLIDDFGLFLRDESPTQIKAAETLVGICKTRRKSGKPTIITISQNGGEVSFIVKKYIEYLKKTYRTVYVGDVDLRLRNYIPDLEEDGGMVLKKQK